MIDIKFIASKAGVSISTVSRVLNKSKPVSPELEKKVVETIEKYNYYPNAFARKLVTKKSNLIVLLIEDNINFFESRWIAELSKIIEEKGYHAIVSITGHDVESKIKTMKQLIVEQIDGAICLFSLSDETCWQIRNAIEFPFCHLGTIGNCISNYNVSYKASYDATEYLIALGHKRIGGLFDSKEDAPDYMRARYDGFVNALKSYNIPFNDKYIACGCITMDDSVALVEQLFDGNDHPTALFCVSDELAISTMIYLLQQGFRVPKDVSIIGYDGLSIGTQLKPALTTIEQPMEFWSEIMVQSLIALIENKEYFDPAREEILENSPHLVIRESCTKLL